jgi:hypothetical protein
MQNMVFNRYFGIFIAILMFLSIQTLYSFVDGFSLDFEQQNRPMPSGAQTRVVSGSPFSVVSTDTSNHSIASDEEQDRVKAGEDIYVNAGKWVTLNPIGVAQDGSIVTFEWITEDVFKLRTQGSRSPCDLARVADIRFELDQNKQWVFFAPQVKNIRMVHLYVTATDIEGNSATDDLTVYIKPYDSSFPILFGIEVLDLQLYQCMQAHSILTGRVLPLTSPASQ